MTPECERFFVQEACFYECDPNAGFYRKFHEDVYTAKCDSGSAEYDEVSRCDEGLHDGDYAMG